jgi:hypothetical protein
MTTWNPSDKAASITLSGGNLVASQTSTGGMVRADTASLSSSNNWYFEVTINNAIVGSAGSNVAVGLSNPSQSLATDFDGVNGIGYYANGMLIGPGISSNIGWSYTTGDIIGVHKTSAGVDFSQNGTIRATWPTLPSGNLFPSSIVFFSGDQVTANFGATTFANLPSGAGAWSPTGSTSFSGAGQAAGSGRADGRSTGSGTGVLVSSGGYFPDTIATVLAGYRVHCDLLVMFDFLSVPMRLWQGFGTLQTLDGNAWNGIGQLGQISDLESAIGGTAPMARFVLSGVDTTLISEALNQAEEIHNRDCNVYMQFFNDDLSPLDNPYVVWAGLMDVVRIIQTGSSECRVEMSAETIFARRALPPLGNLTDREQQRFFPGDDGLKFIPSLMSKTAIWPVILPQA